MMTRSNVLQLTVALLLVTTFTAAVFSEVTRPQDQGVVVQAFPPSIDLRTAGDSQSIIVRAIDSNGVTRDLTASAKLSIDGGSAALDGTTVASKADGEATIRVEAEGQTLTLPVKSQKSGESKPISFRHDIIAVLNKAGCNTGSCHGSARGQDGFHLSLFGYDPEGDYYRITRELPGRRINLAMPDDSLLLLKATGAVPHTGGKLFEKDSLMYGMVKRWIEADVPNDPPTIATVTGVDIYPDNIVLEGEQASQQLTVRAHYSDGSSRDVTSLAVFMSNNDSSAAVSKTGHITAGQRGEAFVMARFDTVTVGTHVIVVPPEPGYVFPDLPANNYIDELVYDKLRKLRVTPSELCTDEEFLRRVYIDIVGQLPTPEERAAFLADTATDKREKVVDTLLGRKEFVEIWVMKWAERLLMRSSNEVSYKSMLLYYSWLQDRLANNVPMDKIVRELLGSSGGTFTEPATNYYQIERDTLKLSENTAQVFMGVRMQCAQCHNHPFDRWTQDDYYGFAAFFSQIGRKRAEDPRETIIFDRRDGEVNHPLDKRVMPAMYLGGGPADVKNTDRRDALADWLTSKDNTFFSRNLANFTWSHFFGRGIVDPVDDVRVSNPPSNEALLDALSDKLVEYNYDFRRLVRDICTSRTYQLSSRTNASNELDESNFSHAAVRRVRSEILLDCITQVTGTRDKFKGLPLGARAVQIADGQTSTYFLTTFGRAPRETVDTCEVVTEPTLSQALQLINGDMVHNKIKQGGLVKKMIDETLSNEQIIERLYVAALSRQPTATEQANIAPLLAETDNRQAALEDVFWALLNSKEFMFNH